MTEIKPEDYKDLPEEVVEDLEIAVDERNKKIKKIDRILKKYPFPIKWIQNYYIKKLLKETTIRDVMWKSLRDIQRVRHPERFSHQASEQT